MTTYITFDTDHDYAHPALGTELSRGYVAVSLPGREQDERELFYAIFGTRFAFDYQDKPGAGRPAFYPKGEIARIQLINEDLRRRIVWTLNATFEAADGDSNDTEIAVLQEARDLLASLIDYTHEED